ncbi:MAG: polyprenyl synthetase family protein [Verrucomicrobiota bacterium]
MKTSLNKISIPLKDLFHSIEGEIQRIDNRISRVSQDFNPAIDGYVDYATENGGKRIRAGLVFLTAEATGGLDAEHDDLAVVVELIHLASLVHDDVLDHAETRRSRATMNARWGTEISVLLGDCLFAHALKLCTRFENREILCEVADGANEVCTGEILQTQRRFDLNLKVPEYMDMIRMKTGALFRVSTELSGLINGVRPEIRSALRQYGEGLGTAYQIYDDCLDLLGTDEGAGKTLGTDLIKGKLTLPVLHMLQQLKPSESDRIHSEILKGSEADFDLLDEHIRSSGGYAYSIRTGRKILDDCRKSTKLLPETKYRKYLNSICDLLEDRLTQF